MNTYKALLTFDDVNATITVHVLENTFTGPAFVWTHDGPSRASVKRCDAFPENHTFTRGTVLNFNGSGEIDGSLFVSVDRTSNEYIEVQIKNSVGEPGMPTQPVPVEFSVY